MSLSFRLLRALSIALLVASFAAACDSVTAPTVLDRAAVSSSGVFEARANEVPMCHLTSEEIVTGADGSQGLGLVGHVIFIAPAAEAAHCRHGDHTPRPDSVTGDRCQRRIDRRTPNVTCAGSEQLIRPTWATQAS